MGFISLRSQFLADEEDVESLHKGISGSSVTGLILKRGNENDENPSICIVHPLDIPGRVRPFPGTAG
jgi:hypothetical protein